MHSEPAPASPPEAMLIAKKIRNSLFLSAFGKRLLMPSLNAKLKAWVGKYRRILVKFPRQNALNPCSDETRLKQLTIPVYQATSPEIIFGFASWVWIKSFTRSIGAVQVLATAPDVPPARKFIL